MSVNKAIVKPFNHFETKEVPNCDVTKQTMARHPAQDGGMQGAGVINGMGYPFVQSTKVNEIKDKIKEEKGITGKALKAILVRISEEQAEVLLSNPALMQQFMDAL